MLAVNGETTTPQLVHTLRTVTQLIIDFEKDRRRFTPEDKYFLIPELTTGMILKHFVCQGIRKEEDANGKLIWFLYLLSAATTTTKRIHKGTTVARINCQRVDTSWPALLALGGRSC